MKRLLMIGVVLTIGILSALEARGCGNCCDLCKALPNLCCGQVEAGGQWIYLRPSSCEFDFAIKDPRPLRQAPSPTDSNFVQSVTDYAGYLPTGQSYDIDPDFRSGFRISAAYVSPCHCYDIRVEYTWHHARNRANIGGGCNNSGIWPSLMSPAHTQNYNLVESAGGTMTDTLSGFQTPLFCWTPAISNAEFTDACASSWVQHDYDAIDLQLASRTTRGCNCNLWIRTYLGLHYMNLDQKQVVDYHGVFFGNDVRRDGATILATSAVGGYFDTYVCTNSNTWGIGPLFGVDSRYHIGCGIGIGVHVGAAVLAGDSHGKWYENDTRRFPNGNVAQTGNFSDANVKERLDVRAKDRSVLFPYIRGSLGLNYLCRWHNCALILFEVGYEFNSYINAVGQFRFNDQRGTGSASCQNYNLDGIYISVRATV
ncbi:MAG: Lpg1974 family pore-forming outer membrane protein [Parachlamydiales bacterium]